MDGICRVMNIHTLHHSTGIPHMMTIYLIDFIFN